MYGFRSSQDHLVRWDGSPVGTSGISRFLKSPQGSPMLAGSFYASANECLAGNAINGIIVTVVMLSFVCYFDRKYLSKLDNLKDINVDHIVIDKTAKAPQDFPLARVLFETSRPNNLIYGLYAGAGVMFAIQDINFLALAGYMAGKCIWGLKRSAYTGGAQWKDCVLGKAQPKWTVHLRHEAPNP